MAQRKSDPPSPRRDGKQCGERMGINLGALQAAQIDVLREEIEETVGRRISTSDVIRRCVAHTYRRFLAGDTTIVE